MALTLEQFIASLRTAVLIQTNDLTVQHSTSWHQLIPDPERKVRERTERVSIARIQGEASVFDYCDGAEAVILDFKDEIGMIKRVSLSERHGREWKHPPVSKSEQELV